MLQAYGGVSRIHKLVVYPGNHSPSRGRLITPLRLQLMASILSGDGSTVAISGSTCHKNNLEILSWFAEMSLQLFRRHIIPRYLLIIKVGGSSQTATNVSA